MTDNQSFTNALCNFLPTKEFLLAHRRNIQFGDVPNIQFGDVPNNLFGVVPDYSFGNVPNNFFDDAPFFLGDAANAAKRKLSCQSLPPPLFC